MLPRAQGSCIESLRLAQQLILSTATSSETCNASFGELFVGLLNELTVTKNMVALDGLQESSTADDDADEVEPHEFVEPQPGEKPW